MSLLRFQLIHEAIGKRTITDPVGWKGRPKNIKRDPNWHGVFFEYTTKLQFIKDGRDLIQFLYETYGIEANITLRIQRKNPITREWRIEFEGRLNLTTYEIDSTQVTCNVENTGFLQKIKNRSDVKVNLSKLVSQGKKDITAFASETEDVEYHSQKLQRIFRKVGAESVGDDTAPGTYYFLPNSGPGLDVNNLYIDQINKRMELPTQLSTLNPVEVGKYHWLMEEAGDYSFLFHFDYLFLDTLFGNTRNWTVQWKLVHGNYGSYTTINLHAVHTAIGAGSISNTVSTTQNVTLSANAEVYLFAEVVIAGGGTTIIEYSMSSTNVPAQDYLLTITASTTYPVTTSPTNLIHEVWTRVVQSISDQDANCFYSELYGRTDSNTVYADDGAGSLRGIINGQRLRGLDKPVEISLNELIKSFKAIDGIGIGIEKIGATERIRVEKITHFYQPKRLMRLESCKAGRKRVVGDLFYNEIEAGYEQWNVNGKQINNLFEFNAPRKWVTPITQVKRMLTLMSSLIGAGFLIEYTRRSRKKDTTDTEFDKSNFVVCLRRDGGDFVTDKDEDFSGGIDDVLDAASVYNMKISPLRMVQRNGRLIRSFLEKHLDDTIEFNSGDGNTAVVSFEDVVTPSSLNEAAGFQEGEHINIDQLDRPLWLPEIYPVTAKLTEEQFDALATTDPDADANIYGYVEFVDSGVVKRGFVYSAEISDTNEVAFELLRANI